MGTDKYGEKSDWSAAIKPMGVAAGGDKTGGRLALCRLPRGAKRGYGRIRTATDKYGRLTCWSAAISRITISRASGANNNYLTPVRLQPDDRRKSQRAYFRGVIAPLFASFAEEPRQERTCVRDWSGDDRKARESKRERPVYKKKWSQLSESNR